MNVFMMFDAIIDWDAIEKILNCSTDHEVEVVGERVGKFSGEGHGFHSVVYWCEAGLVAMPIVVIPLSRMRSMILMTLPCETCSSAFISNDGSGSDCLR